jgi:hypothetical protein
VYAGCAREEIKMHPLRCGVERKEGRREAGWVQSVQGKRGRVGNTSNNPNVCGRRRSVCRLCKGREEELKSVQRKRGREWWVD